MIASFSQSSNQLQDAVRGLDGVFGPELAERTYLR
jgi:hypothetical protein